MLKTLTAGITALSLGFAAPAQAAPQGDDLGKLIAGIAAVALLGAAIDASSRGNATVTLTNPRTPNRNAHRNSNRSGYHAQVGPLPSQCLVNVPTRRGITQIYGSRCMSRNFERANRLPEVCSVTLEGARRDRSGYVPDCLRRFGYAEEGQGSARRRNH